MNRQREVQALLRRGHQIQSKLSKLCEVRTNSINRRYNSGEDLDSGRVHALSLMLKTPEEPLKRCLRQSFYHGRLLVCKYTRDRSVRQLLSSQRCVHFCLVAHLCAHEHGAIGRAPQPDCSNRLFVPLLCCPNRLSHGGLRQLRSGGR